MNYRQLYAIQKKNEQRIKKEVPETLNISGIYIMTRFENGFKYAYVGQAKHLIDRLASHLSGYQHIDLSLRKYGLKSENENGWEINTIYCNEERLDSKEQEWVKYVADKGYQLYNCTTGSQGKDKRSLKETVRKGYNQGLENGYKKAQKEIANLFEKHLNVSVKKKGNKNQIKALEKFENFIDKE